MPYRLGDDDGAVLNGEPGLGNLAILGEVVVPTRHKSWDGGGRRERQSERDTETQR